MANAFAFMPKTVHGVLVLKVTVAGFIHCIAEFGKE